MATCASTATACRVSGSTPSRSTTVRRCGRCACRPTSGTRCRPSTSPEAPATISPELDYLLWRYAAPAARRPRTRRPPPSTCSPGGTPAPSGAVAVRCGRATGARRWRSWASVASPTSRRPSPRCGTKRRAGAVRGRWPTWPSSTGAVRVRLVGPGWAHRGRGGAVRRRRPATSTRPPTPTGGRRPRSRSRPHVTVDGTGEGARRRRWRSSPPGRSGSWWPARRSPSRRRRRAAPDDDDDHHQHHDHDDHDHDHDDRPRPTPPTTTTAPTTSVTPTTTVPATLPRTDDDGGRTLTRGRVAVAVRARRPRLVLARRAAVRRRSGPLHAGRRVSAAQQGQDVAVRGRREVPVPLADGAELERSQRAHEVVGQVGDELARIGGADRHGGDQPGRPGGADRPHRGPHRRPGGQAVVDDDHHPAAEGQRRGRRDGNGAPARPAPRRASIGGPLDVTGRETELADEVVVEHGQATGGHGADRQLALARRADLAHGQDVELAADAVGRRRRRREPRRGAARGRAGQAVLRDAAVGDERSATRSARTRPASSRSRYRCGDERTAPSKHGREPASGPTEHRRPSSLVPNELSDDPSSA